jgi:superfamily II DNA or RNA helicase
MQLEVGQRIHIPGQHLPEWVTIEDAIQSAAGWRLYVRTDTGGLERVDQTEAEAENIQILEPDGGGDSRRVLAGLWTQWMSSAASDGAATLLASTPLRPYAHQSNAVYGAMLPQPRLRFLLADEPGTGKTIMAGMYLREMQRLGLVNRALIVVPAGLVSKWKADFERFFGGELRRITNETVQQHGLVAPHDMWVISLELAANNASVQDAIRPDRGAWDIVVFDEAHRLTPTAETLYRVGSLLAKNSRLALLMTATPHRGSEWLFRHLLHLVDPAVYPDPGNDPKPELRPIKPGPIHFLRRMKEDLVDYDGKTPLFKGRRATNKTIPLSVQEYAFYTEALGMVDEFFPASAAPLARMVYGKRAASSLYALAETLRRRSASMGSVSAAEATLAADPNDEDPSAQEEARVVTEGSKSAARERRAIEDLLGRLEPLVTSGDHPVSKWKPLVVECLGEQGIKPGNSEQAVLFTEYADTADWLVKRLVHEGFSARRYSGRDTHQVRDEVRAAFMSHDFQIFVSTDAGNEGIDLQAARVLVNYDIPWSLVRLEQRMGRIHRVGQTRDVELFNLIAQDTREGDVLAVLLRNFVDAANQLEGKMFDSLSLVAELTGLGDERLATLLADAYGQDEAKRTAALSAAKMITASKLVAAAEQARKEEAVLASAVDVATAIRQLRDDVLERINPAIVEAYLQRLDRADVFRLAQTASGEGIYQLSTIDGSLLSAELGGRRRAVVATSGNAVTVALAAGAVLTGVPTIGPGEPAFNSLVLAAQSRLAPDVFRGGTVADPTSIQDYGLFAFEAKVTEGGGKKHSPWTALIRVDEAGARPVRWEVLANLTESGGNSEGPMHPARLYDAQARAQQLLLEDQEKRKAAQIAWLQKAEKELRALPGRISQDVPERERRVETRSRVQRMVDERLAELRVLTDVVISGLRLTAHVLVRAQGIPAEPTEADSERIATKRVRDLLAADGWAVADVHTEGRGYDLYATRGQMQRCIEVKGLWGSASSTGVRLTGNEILIATQQRGDYWLYVIDRCGEGQGLVFGVYRDPVSTFAGLIQQQAIFTIPGSALLDARDRVDSA